MAKLWEAEADAFLLAHGHEDTFMHDGTYQGSLKSPTCTNTMVITSGKNASGTFPDKNDMKIIKRQQKKPLKSEVSDKNVNTSDSSAMGGEGLTTDGKACPMSGKTGGKCPWGFGSATANATTTSNS